MLERAKPLLTAIAAPTTSLLLRKEVAALAGITQAELEGLYAIRPVAAAARRAPQKARVTRGLQHAHTAALPAGKTGIGPRASGRMACHGELCACSNCLARISAPAGLFRQHGCRNPAIPGNAV